MEMSSNASEIIETPSAGEPPAPLLLPDLPCFVLHNQGACVLDSAGEFLELNNHEAIQYLSNHTVLLCHGPSITKRLETGQFIALDLLELFAFIHPAQFCAPSIKGLCNYYNIDIPHSYEDEAMALNDLAYHLLNDLRQQRFSKKTDLVGLLAIVKDWRWTPFILNALGLDNHAIEQATSRALKVWKELPEWSEHAPEQPPGHLPLSEDEADQNLTNLLAHMKAEPRQAQRDYTRRSAHAFQPRAEQGKPNVVLAEAGTGTGKTLGYLAGAQAWAQKNEGQVWLSTYTKNLQRQIDTELDKAYPDSLAKKNKTVVRKGRENYLCLLNYEELARRASMPNGALQTKLMAVLLARWIGETRYGDLKGGDLPGWMHDLIQRGRLYALSDQRGECIHAACPHFHRCFIEKNVRQSKRAELVVANHALVMVQNALAGEYLEDIRNLPTRYVFDEAHHLFDAADSAFAAHLSGRETLELRRWILGNEHSRGYRAARGRGLKSRCDELLGQDDIAIPLINEILFAARELASNGWLDRLKDNNPQGTCETFLHQVNLHVLRLSEAQDPLYTLEAEKDNQSDELIKAAFLLQEKLLTLHKVTNKLIMHLENRLNEEADTLEPGDKQKMEALSKSLHRRLLLTLEAWLSMLKNIEFETPPDFKDWYVIERNEGYDFDIGFYRHWIDPTIPFTKSLENQSHGLIFTSATLKDSRAEEKEVKKEENEGKDNQWRDYALGIEHFEKPLSPVDLSIHSPFDYAEQSRIFIINDLDIRNIPRVANAYRALFEASQGGGLGLFTAIQRLKAVHQILAPKLEESGLPLYAQHVDGMEITTLVDLFKLDPHSCLLGTDATRDGVDIPGDSLRLLVFDKVPWPRPHLLHKARRAHFGGRHYDERLTRLKLKQGFGRLIRSNQDRGVFVMLESRLPTRLCNAFPETAPIERLPLFDALAKIKDFLKTSE